MVGVLYETVLAPEEPEVRGCCAWCGDEIYEGETVYTGDEGRVHRECLLPMLEENLGMEYLAELCGYEEGVA